MHSNILQFSGKLSAIIAIIIIVSPGLFKYKIFEIRKSAEILAINK